MAEVIPWTDSLDAIRADAALLRAALQRLKRSARRAKGAVARTRKDLAEPDKVEYGGVNWSLFWILNAPGDVDG